MVELNINPEFEKLIPPLGEDELQQLEDNILTYGIRDPIVVWKGSIVDGHNRFSIAQKHGLADFSVFEMDFEDENAAKLWIIDNQLGRRNLPPFARIELAKLKEPLIKLRAEQRMLAGTDPFQIFGKGSEQPVHTHKELSKLAGVSHETLRKAEKILEKGSPESIKDLREGKKKINTVYREIQPDTNESKCIEKSGDADSDINEAADDYDKPSLDEDESAWHRIRRENQEIRDADARTRDASRENTYTFEVFKDLFKRNTDDYIDGLRDCIEVQFTPLWQDDENKLRALAILNRTIAILEKIGRENFATDEDIF